MAPTDEIEQEEALLESTEFDVTFDKEIAAIPAAVRVVMEKLAFKIKNDGLNIDEACLLCNVDPDWIAARIDEHPVIARAFAKKDLEYRVALMRPLNKKAKVDEKMAQYLLEMRYPKGRKNAAGGNGDDESKDMLAMAISHIQEHGDSTPLVKRTSGAAVIMARGATATKLMDRIKAVLA